MVIFNYNQQNSFLKDYKPLTDNLTKYEQSINGVINHVEDINKEEGYTSIEECILSTYDIYYLNDSTIEYIQNKLFQIGDDLSENYIKFNYSKKHLPLKVIETGLHSLNNLSNIIYLSDIYQCSIYLSVNDIHFRLTRDYQNKLHIIYDKSLFQIIQNPSDLDTGKVNVLNTKEIPITVNIEKLFTDYKLSDIYNKYITNINKYKLDDLIDIANGINIETTIGSRKKTKAQLFEEINNKFS